MEDEVTYIVKIPTGYVPGYNITVVGRDAWDEICSYYEDDDIWYEYECEDGEICNFNLSEICDLSEVVAVDPSEDVMEFIEEVEDRTMFGILCNATADSEKYSAELNYKIMSVLNRLKITQPFVYAISYGKNQLVGYYGNRKIFITLYEDLSGVPQRTMRIEIIDLDSNSQPLTKVILGEDDDYKQLTEYLEEIIAMTKDVEKIDNSAFEEGVAVAPSVSELNDGIVKAQTEDVSSKLEDLLKAE